MNFDDFNLSDYLHSVDCDNSTYINDEYFCDSAEESTQTSAS